MKPILAVAAAVLLSGSALAASGSPVRTKTSAPGPGKPQAPVAISATLQSGRATVTVGFQAPASDVSVEVHGVDGLVVTSAAVPLSGGRFARGQAVTLDVTFTDGPGPGQLAVSVTGQFRGARRNAVATFVTRPPAVDERKPARPATTDSTGRRIKVMPSDGR